MDPSQSLVKLPTFPSGGHVKIAASSTDEVRWKGSRIDGRAGRQFSALASIPEFQSILIQGPWNESVCLFQLLRGGN